MEGDRLVVGASGDDGGGSGIFASEWRIADFISFVHLINWKVVEPERSKAARTELLEMIRLSREDWKAIRAETDNDREWLPGPQQTGANLLTGLDVTEEQVQGKFRAVQSEYKAFKEQYGPRLESQWNEITREQIFGKPGEKAVRVNQMLDALRRDMSKAKSGS